MNILLIAAGGAAGALSRYFLQGWVSNRTPSAFPYGTFAVNILGSFLLGFLAVVGLDRFAFHVDSPERIAALIPELDRMVGEGLVFSADNVNIVKYRKAPRPGLRPS